MKSITSIAQAQAHIDHLYTHHYIRENYGVEGLVAYIQGKRIAIQTDRILENWHKRKYDARSIGKVWWGILDIALKSSRINLWQMMCNYQQARDIWQKNAVADTIIQAVVPSMQHDELHIEALILWVCLLLWDDADSRKVNSLVDYVDARVGLLLTTTHEDMQKLG